jgi:hypothetical protein
VGGKNISPDSQDTRGHRVNFDHLSTTHDGDHRQISERRTSSYQGVQYIYLLKDEDPIKLILILAIQAFLPLLKISLPQI